MHEHVTIQAAMRSAAIRFLDGLDERQRSDAFLPFTDSARRWFTYLPRPRAGVCLADLNSGERKAARRLLATALSPSGYAQATAIMALEEVLDRCEGWRRGRHDHDYWIAVFGDPARDDSWAWRWEGHHLSVSLTLDGNQVHPTPLFFGAHPATVRVAGERVLRPLGPEEDLARALMEAMGPQARRQAIVAGTAPSDIRSSTSPVITAPITPAGVGMTLLNQVSKGLLGRLVAVYLSRLAGELAARETTRLAGTEMFFAWEGPLRPEAGHYYRIQGPGLLIEYDNTANDANHAHTVLRYPAHDFGGHALP
ncbi:MAG TPA: DUF3500 domain-containing protein [Streptosporangiaceae bacterium]|jgi:hypothetical protein